MKNGDGKNDEAQLADARTRGAANAAAGRWGEDIAAEFLRQRGWTAIGRNVKPCATDRRCEIDLIVRSRDRRSIVFVEVKTHARHSPRASRLWCIDRRKKNLLLRACTNWILRNKWHGNFRFDVVEVYGSPTRSEPPEIDHIENVSLFPQKWRFW